MFKDSQLNLFKEQICIVHILNKKRYTFQQKGFACLWPPFIKRELLLRINILYDCIFSCISNRLGGLGTSFPLPKKEQTSLGRALHKGMEKAALLPMGTAQDRA